MIESRLLSNQASKEALVGRLGGGGSARPLRKGEIVVQSDLVQSSSSTGAAWTGWANVREIEIWSEPVEGSGVSHVMKKGARVEEANARSMTEGLASPPRGNLV